MDVLSKTFKVARKLLGPGVGITWEFMSNHLGLSGIELGVQPRAQNMHIGVFCFEGALFEVGAKENHNLWALPIVTLTHSKRCHFGTSHAVQGHDTNMVIQI